MKYLLQERVPASHLGRTPKTASYAFTREKKEGNPWRIKITHQRSNGSFFLTWNLFDRRLPFWFYLEHLKCSSLSTEYRNTRHLFEGSFYLIFNNIYLKYMTHKGFILHTNNWMEYKFYAFSPIHVHVELWGVILQTLYSKKLLITWKGKCIWCLITQGVEVGVSLKPMILRAVWSKAWLHLTNYFKEIFSLILAYHA